MIGISNNLIYKNLIERKFCKHCFQLILCKEFEIYGENFLENIYECKITDIKDKHVEFSYKLLDNIYYVIMYRRANGIEYKISIYTVNK